MGAEEGEGQPEARRRSVQAQDEQLIMPSSLYRTPRLAAAAVLVTLAVADRAAAQDATPSAAPARAPQGAARAPRQERPGRNAGSIRVVVPDQSGAAILGATVSVIAVNAAPGTEAKTATANDQGEAVIERLAPGKYLVQIESVGFET